jgi:hypothetical protein
MNLNEKASSRLNHVDSHLNGRIFPQERLNLLCNRIINHENNFYSCFLSLEGYVVAKGISSWFHVGDISELKNWFYAKAKLEYICANSPYNESGELLAYENRALFGMFCLILDHEPLINWYSNLDQTFDKKSVENTKSFEFYTKQFFLALRGEWEVLSERCERILTNPPTASREKKYLIDHQFYLALAKGDVSGMESAIKELVTPKRIASRSSLEGGYTENLLCTPAVIYSKLAWRNGYEIVVDSPYIPKEWLPIKPLDVYEDVFGFMKKYQVC